MRRIASLFIIIFLFVLSACAGTDVRTTPSASGQVAPDFTLTDQDGKAWKLSDAVKKYRAVVLAFYPKDDTKLWIRQFVEFQQNIKKYEAKKIKILGLSRDSAESHRKFIAKHGLKNITLLVDEKGTVAKMYDADHWLLPLSKRVYVIIGKKMHIMYKKDMGFALLPDQTETLMGAIDNKAK